MGAPGDVDNQNGVLRYNPNLKFKDVADWPMAEQLFKHTGIRPVIANDATLAAWGVYEADLKRQGTNVLVVTLGTGVGGGMIINKELYQGSNGTAGEIGHTKIADLTTGPLCGCGSRGCLEAFVGTIGIKRRVYEAIVDYPDSILAKMVKEESDFKIEIVSRAAEKGCKSVGGHRVLLGCRPFQLYAGIRRRYYCPDGRCFRCGQIFYARSQTRIGCPAVQNAL